jgi:hypothetical protein
MPKIELQDVTAEEMENIRGFLSRSGFTGFEGHAGKVTGDCMDLDFTWDEASGRLVMDVSKFPLKLHEVPEEIATPTFKNVVISALGRTGIILSECAVYNHVWTTLTNNSGGSLTYSDSGTSHGTVSIDQNTIGNGGNVQAFSAKSNKDSGVGAYGWVEYLFADGSTKLKMAYGLNTTSTHSFTAGLSGPNAPRYKVVTSNTDSHYDAGGVYAYMKPEVTVDTA